MSFDHAHTEFTPRESHESHHRRLPSESDTTHRRQRSPSDSYLTRKHVESMYDHQVSNRPARRSNKAFALLQEFKEAEEQRLAEMHPYYSRPSKNVKLQEMMAGQQNGVPSFVSELPDGKGETYDHGLFQELEAVERGKSRYPYSHSRHNTMTAELYGSHHPPPYNRPFPSSENLIELDGEPAEAPMPELQGSEPQMQGFPAAEWRPSAQWGDKRFNTVCGEPFPVTHGRKKSDPTQRGNQQSPGIAVSGAEPPTSFKLIVENVDKPKWILINPDTDPRSGLPLSNR